MSQYFGVSMVMCFICFQTGLRRNKLNILVNFPITGLDMGRHILQKDGKREGPPSQGMSDLYDLYAVTNHYGNMNGGHYTGNYEPQCEKMYLLSCVPKEDSNQLRICTV